MSIGEKSFASYERFRKAGADRYLLRHETADDALYCSLHTNTMSLENRKQCLYHFIPHHDTIYAKESAGSVEMTLYLLSIIRIMLPKALIPAPIALGTMDPLGREKGIMAGANVVMANLSPVKNRKLYELYDNKICTGEEAAECRGCMSAEWKVLAINWLWSEATLSDKKSCTDNNLFFFKILLEKNSH